MVRRQDDPETAAGTTPFFVGLAGIFGCVVASAFVTSEGVRLLLWALGALWAIGVPVAAMATARARARGGMSVSESMAERFGLFTIIVLGEVMVGVVNGLAAADGSAATTAVGLLSLGVGFGLWWNYFDFVGLRQPRGGRDPRGVWMVAHLPLAGSVAATGAAMASLVAHASDDRTPAPVAWVLGGSVAVVCLSLAVVLRQLPPRPGVRRVPADLVIAALLALATAALRPAPWVLVLVLVLLLSAVWAESFVRHARLGVAFIAGREAEG